MVHHTKGHQDTVEVPQTLLLAVGMVNLQVAVVVKQTMEVVAVLVPVVVGFMAQVKATLGAMVVQLADRLVVIHNTLESVASVVVVAPFTVVEVAVASLVAVVVPIRLVVVVQVPIISAQVQSPTRITMRLTDWW